MTDCNSDIKGYHSERVKLTGSQRKQLIYWRDANRDRLRSGLENNNDPSPKKSVSQGSHAMRTTIQEPGDKYDIDDGVVFKQEDLQGPRGAEKTAREARKMVRDAVQDERFSRQPEIKTNCVRVFYNEGPHVDIPVYRSNNTGYELASSDWKESDPEGVNSWFSECVNRKNAQGMKHFRELIRLIKSMCKNRPSYSLPSGFVITVLVNERYTVGNDRLDIDLYKVIKSLHERLCANLRVPHPVVGEWLIDGDKEHKTKKLREILGDATKTLKCLDQINCTRSQALKAWKEVLCTDYFQDKIAEVEEKEKKKTIEMVAAASSYNPRQYSNK